MPNTVTGRPMTFPTIAFAVLCCVAHTCAQDGTRQVDLSTSQPLQLPPPVVQPNQPSQSSAVDNTSATSLPRPILPAAAPAAAPGPILVGETEAVVPVRAGSSNYDPAFPWATSGESWSIPHITEEVADMHASGPYNLVIYGDSIMQCLRFEMSVCSGVSKLTKERYGKYRPYVLAVGNERVTSLMNRFLRDGALPVGINKDNVTAVVIMVGNNDIGHMGAQSSQQGEVVGEKVAGWLTEMIYFLLDQDPKIQVVPVSLLPATGGDYNYVNSQLYIPDQEVNQQLQYLSEVNPRIHYVDCVDPFLNKDDPTKVNASLIPDGTHPSYLGWQLLTDCLEPTLDEVLAPIVQQTEAQAVATGVVGSEGVAAPAAPRPPAGPPAVHNFATMLSG